MLKGIAYLRASTTDQKDSLDSQQKAVVDYFNKLGLDKTEYLIYMEHRTGSDPRGSKVLASCVQACIKNKVNLTTHALDRIARDITYLIGLFKKLNEIDRFVYSLSEGLLSNYHFFALLSVNAEIELYKKAERQRIQRELSELKDPKDRKKAGRKSGFRMDEETKKKVGSSISEANKYVPSWEVLELTKAIVKSKGIGTPKGELYSALMEAYANLGHTRKGKPIKEDLTREIYLIAKKEMEGKNDI